MRKLAFTFALILCFGLTSHAQQDPNAKRVLDAMKNKYESYSAFKISIVQDLLNSSDKVMNSIALKATVKKNKYIIELADQIIYNNERTIWRYLPDEKEVTIHNNNSEEEGEDLFQSPSNLYKLYKDGFKYKMVASAKVGNTTCDVIELSPIDRDQFDFFKVKLFVSKTDKTLKQWTVFEKDQDTLEVARYRYKVTKFTPNIKVTDQNFSFNVPADVTIIDMRDE
ncbi:MAG: LolA family protein [Flammeovirgaceae bacterium]